MKTLDLGRGKALVVLPEYNDNVYMSLRNITNIKGTVVNDMNTYDILNANKLIFTESAAKLFSEAAMENAEA